MDKALFMYYLNKNNYSVKTLSEKLPMSRQALYDKISGRTDFKTSEIKTIKALLALSAEEVDNIFFNDLVSYKDTNISA